MVQIKDKTNLRDSSHELHQEGAKSHHKIDFVLKTETERHRQDEMRFCSFLMKFVLKHMSLCHLQLSHGSLV